ncbi:MAG: prepilin-type N-terminal cleavage/methylation domain-containing protein [Burkholderiaceae bacterium]|nr:prepilin-type N-terminal cleavage/methylation domain-containing protein [Burkholderiaceae bacterium]
MRRTTRARQQTRRAAALRRQRGLSIVELMVASVIAMVASMAIFQTYASNEERRRTTTSGGEGLQAGLFALATIERAIINAGYNLTVVSDPGYTSPVRLVDPGTAQFTLSTNSPPRPEFHVGCIATIGGVPTRIAPLVATSGGAGLASDTFTVFSGNSPNVPVPAPAETGGLAAGASTIRLRSTHGFAVGDWVLVYEQSSAVNAGTTRPRACTLARVTGLPGAPAISPADITISAPTAATYDEPMVINLGAAPLLEQYRVDADNRLVVRDLLANTPERVVSDNIMSMKLQLGVDVGNDDVIDAWVDPPANADVLGIPSYPLAPNQISVLPVVVGTPGVHQIKAIRIGLLVRSPRFERPDQAGNCSVSGAGPFQILPQIAGDAARRLPEIPAAGTYSLAGDQLCFRYNTATSLAPVRNVILSEM